MSDPLPRYLSAFTGSAERRLDLPFSRGGWTYASDASIAIRVPRIASVPEIAGTAEGIESLPWPIATGADAGWIKIPALPPMRSIDCPECAELAGGKPSKRCGECDGRGRVTESQRVKIGAAEICSEYLRRAKIFLPAPRILPPAAADEVLRIRFDGGAGVLMPLRPVPEDGVIHRLKRE